VKTTLKDWPKVYRKLKSVRRLTEDERIQFARSHAGTPDEPWQLKVNCINAPGLGGRVRAWHDMERREAKSTCLQSPGLWKAQISNEERASGRMLGFAALKGVR
jgi:hypothetical protein